MVQSHVVPNLNDFMRICQGIGRGIVEEFLEQGCTVLTCARDPAVLADLEAQYSGLLKVIVEL